MHNEPQLLEAPLPLVGLAEEPVLKFNVRMTLKIIFNAENNNTL